MTKLLKSDTHTHNNIYLQMYATMKDTSKITQSRHGFYDVLYMPNNKMHLPSKSTPGHKNQGATQEQTGPLIHAPNPTVQRIEFTFIHDRYMDQAIKTKHDK